MENACLRTPFGWRGTGPTWTEVEVTRNELGRPDLALTGDAAAAAREMGVASIHLSLTHVASLAAAVVVLEGESGATVPASVAPDSGGEEG